MYGRIRPTSEIAEAGGHTRAFTYDAAGNTTYDNRSGGGYGYGYDAAGRMATFAINGVLQANYRYNALGQQVVRELTQTGEVIHAVHDMDGNRIAEYLYDDATGTSTLMRQYIWMEGRVVAVVKGGEIFYVRTDHIGRPVFATNDLGVKVWEASYLPFGGVHVATGGIDLRFPGQWFQAESGLHQNWMRDADPTQRPVGCAFIAHHAISKEARRRAGFTRPTRFQIGAVAGARACNAARAL